MQVYHVTSATNADSILQAGFRDATGRFLTSRTHRRVWVADRPLLEGMEVAADDLASLNLVVLRLTIPVRLFTEHEWREKGKTYREALIPAASLNANGPAQRVSE